MQVTWLHTGDDGRSHFADLDVPLHPTDAAPHRSAPRSAPIPAANVFLAEAPVGRALDFHPAPRRQLIVVLSGVLEIECGDGTRRQFRAGDMLLADDTTGQGHITRDLEGPRRALYVPLPDFDPSVWHG
jgi:hypothetical protein